MRKTFVRNGNEMYALMSEPCVMDHLRNRQVRVNSPGTEADQKYGSRKHTSFLTKYEPESNSWEDVTSFDHLDVRGDFCIVANDNFIYFIGGSEWCGDKRTLLTDVDRFDLSRKQWDKAADTQMANCWAKGAAVNEKIYITFRARPQECHFSYDWEVYDETTNEWQIITGIRDGLRYNVHILPVDGELFILDIKTVVRCKSVGDPTRIRIERYYPEENKCETKTEVTARQTSGFCYCYYEPVIACSMRIFKGIFNMRQVEAFPADDSLPVATTNQPSLTSKKRERKCLIM